jgi:hypothetical protein
MSKTSAPRGDTIQLRELERGSALGFWHRPVEGFAWREDLVVLESGHHQAEADDGGPWLVPVGTRWERYPVLRKRSRVLADFDRVSRAPTPDAIRAFANEYGWLGFPCGVSVPAGPIFDAEPLTIWRRELLRFRELREVWGAVRVLQNVRLHDQREIKGARGWLTRHVRWSPDHTAVTYHNLLLNSATVEKAQCAVAAVRRRRRRLHQRLRTWQNSHAGSRLRASYRRYRARVAVRTAVATYRKRTYSPARREDGESRRKGRRWPERRVQCSE